MKILKLKVWSNNRVNEAVTIEEWRSHSCGATRFVSRVVKSKGEEISNLEF